MARSDLMSLRWVIVRSRELESTTKLVALALEMHCREELRCWPSIETLTDETSLSRRSVINHLNVLVEKGWLTRLRGLRPSTTYAFIVAQKVVKNPWRSEDEATIAARRMRLISESGIGAGHAIAGGPDFDDHPYDPGATPAFRGASRAERGASGSRILEPDAHEEIQEGFKKESGIKTLVESENRECDLFDMPVAEKMTKAKRIEIEIGRFGEFWQVYPRRVGRREAEVKWAAVIRRGHSADTIIEAARRYAAKMAGKEPQFIKHPSGWLNGERFLDAQEADPMIQAIIGRPVNPPPAPSPAVPPPPTDGLDPGEQEFVATRGRRMDGADERSFMAGDIAKLVMRTGDLTAMMTDKQPEEMRVRYRARLDAALDAFRIRWPSRYERVLRDVEAEISRRQQEWDQERENAQRWAEKEAAGQSPCENAQALIRQIREMDTARS
jgi:hypothetical protein